VLTLNTRTGGGGCGGGGSGGAVGGAGSHSDRCASAGGAGSDASGKHVEGSSLCTLVGDTRELDASGEGDARTDRVSGEPRVLVNGAAIAARHVSSDERGVRSAASSSAGSGATPVDVRASPCDCAVSVDFMAAGRALTCVLGRTGGGERGAIAWMPAAPSRGTLFVRPALLVAVTAAAAMAEPCEDSATSSSSRVSASDSGRLARLWARCAAICALLRAGSRRALADPLRRAAWLPWVSERTEMLAERFAGTAGPDLAGTDGPAAFVLDGMEGVARAAVDGMLAG
jgi:hypothetical protein